MPRPPRHPDHVDVVGRVHERGRRHRVPARVTAVDQCDRVPEPGLGHGRPGALLLVGPRLQDPGTRDEQVADPVDVPVGPDEHRGPAELLPRAGRQRVQGAGPDHREPPAPRPAYDRAGRHRGARGRSALGDEEFTAAQQGRGLGHRRGTDSAEGRARGVRHRDRRQLLGAEGHHRHPEPFGRPENAGLVGPGVDGGELGDGLHGQPGVPERRFDEPEHLVHGDTAEAPTPTTREGGRRRTSRSAGSTALSLTRIEYVPAAATRIGGSGQAVSALSTTGSPRSRARVTPATSPSTGKPSVSKPGGPKESATVLTSRSASGNSPTSRASSSETPASRGGTRTLPIPPPPGHLTPRRAGGRHGRAGHRAPPSPVPQAGSRHRRKPRHDERLPPCRHPVERGPRHAGRPSPRPPGPGAPDGGQFPSSCASRGYRKQFGPSGHERAADVREHGSIG